MTKELQDRVWKHFLPKEFKEEVKYEYRRVATKATKDSYDLGFMHAHEGMFGHHNLTSDAEGEDEMLTVSRKRVQEMYAANERIKADFPDKETAHISDHINHVLKRLFGSKCLPDNVESSEPNVESSEPNVDSLPQNPTENCDNKSHISADCNKQAEPKFKVGDIVRFKYCCTPHRIDGFKMLDGVMLYQVGEVWAEESDLEPYTEPKEDLIASNSGELKSQEADKHSDNILKDSFRNHNRLHIAAMAMQGILSNIDLFKNVLEAEMETLSGDGFSYQAVAKASLLFADALIAESEKRTGHGK